MHTNDGPAAQSIEIIRVKPEHAPLVKTLFRQIEAEAQPDNPAAPDLAESGFDRARASYDFLGSDACWLLLALRDGEAVGYATLVRIPKADARVAVLFLDELYVLERFRRHGVATALIHQGEAIAREIGAWRLRLLVDPNNEAGRQLYASLGFAMNELILCQQAM